MILVAYLLLKVHRAKWGSPEWPLSDPWVSWPCLNWRQLQGPLQGSASARSERWALKCIWATKETHPSSSWGIFISQMDGCPVRLPLNQALQLNPTPAWNQPRSSLGSAGELFSTSWEESNFTCLKVFYSFHCFILSKETKFNQNPISKRKQTKTNLIY